MASSTNAFSLRLLVMTWVTLSRANSYWCGSRLRQQAERAERVEQPVVERPLVLELERADAVRDLLERILDRVRVGVHRVDAPCVAGVVVGRPLDAVERRVAQVDVRARHVDLRAQHRGAVGEIAGAHRPKACEVLGRRAVAVRAVGARMAEVAAGRAHRLGALLVDVGMAGRDQRLRGAVHEVEIVARVVQVARAVRVPVVAEPGHRVEDAVDVLLLLLLGIGVVEAHVADAAVFGGEAEVQRDAFRMADVQVAVRLRREARADAGRIGGAGSVCGGVAGLAGEATAGVGALGEVAFDDVAQEVAALRRIGPGRALRGVFARFHRLGTGRGSTHSMRRCPTDFACGRSSVAV
jgi:hypothetical protein